MVGKVNGNIFSYWLNPFDKVSCGVVFLSAVQNYSINTNKRSAFDYLLKPLDHVELEDMITRFENKKRKETTVCKQCIILLFVPSISEKPSHIDQFPPEQIGHLYALVVIRLKCQSKSAQSGQMLPCSTLCSVIVLMTHCPVFNVYKELIN